jgi:hypothetical protein
MLIAGVLGAMAFPAFTKFMSRREVINARDAFVMMAARARALAVERGDVVVLRVPLNADSVLIISGDGADTLEVLNLADGETIASVVVPSSLTICYVPRGFAHPGCGTGNLLPVTVQFTNGAHTIQAEINAIGQVERR